MAIAADDDVIVHGDAKRLPGFHDLAGHLDVGAARARIARGVVVHHAIHYAKTLINKQIM